MQKNASTATRPVCIGVSPDRCVAITINASVKRNRLSAAEAPGSRFVMVCAANAEVPFLRGFR